MITPLLTVGVALATYAGHVSDALVVAELDPGCRVWSSTPLTQLPVGPARRALPGTVSAHITAGGKLSLTSEGAPASSVLIAIADAAKLSVSVHAARGREPVFATLEGTEPRDALKAVALSVGLVMLQAGKNELAFVDINESDFAIRTLAASREKALPATLRLIPAQRSDIAARALARFVLGCRGRALALEKQGVVLVEDVRDNLDRAEALVRAVEEKRPRAVLAAPSRARDGIHGDAPVCGAHGAADIDARTTAALLAFTSAQRPAVIGCVPDLVATGAKPSWTALTVVGLAPVTDLDGEGTKRGPLARPANVAVWTSDALARRYQASFTSNAVQLVVYGTAHAEEFSRAASFALGREAALGDDRAGVAVVQVRSADELDLLDRLLAQLPTKLPAKAHTVDP